MALSTGIYTAKTQKPLLPHPRMERSHGNGSTLPTPSFSSLSFFFFYHLILTFPFFQFFVASPLPVAEVEPELGRGRDGEREDRDKEDREFDEPAGDLLQEEERIAQEGEGDHCSLRCRGLPRSLLSYWKDVRVLQFFHHVNLSLSLSAADLF